MKPIYNPKEVIERIERIEEEAAVQLKNSMLAYDIYLDEEDVNAIRAARNAFEKQNIPQKPLKIPDPDCDFIIGYYCPKCRCYFGQRGKRNVILFQKAKRCDCGQAIDWSEEDL